MTGLEGTEAEEIRALAEESKGAFHLVVAYTDTTGSPEKNREVAQKRALSVSGALEGEVAGLQSAYVGSTDRFGKDDPREEPRRRGLGDRAVARVAITP